MKKILFILSLLFVFSCNKDDGNEAEVTEDIVLYDNVKIISSDDLTLDINSQNINQGKYIFTAEGTAPTISVGDVIVGDQGEGFIRKVSFVAIEGSTITLQTTQGSMSDVFKRGTFNFDMGLDNMAQGRTASDSGFSHSISNFTLYQQGPLSLVLNSGNISFNPNWHFDFSFNETGLQHFEMGAQGAMLNGDFTATVTAQQSVSTSYSNSILTNGKPYTKSYTVWVPAVLLGVPVEVPVTVVIEVDVIADFSASINAAVSRQGAFTASNTLDIGFKYTNQWEGIYQSNPQTDFTLSQSSGNAGFTVNLGLTPKVKAKLYGIVGLTASLGVQEELKGNVASPALDWDFQADVWLKTTLGAEAGFSILDYDVTASYTHTWESDKLSYITPYRIESTSGSNQIGQQDQSLPQPMKIRVLDNLDHPQKNVPVYFTVTEGGGSANPASILTDDQGYAQTTWMLGNNVEHELHATAKKADGTPIGAPAVFFATAETEETGCTGDPIVTDIDGNTYNTVSIGTQCWMQSNLNVSHYRNGDEIPQVQDTEAWTSLTTGAWCYYYNNTANGPVYGKLYNWYAVNDPRGLAPEGWHVPSNVEWDILSTYLGGNAVAGGKMKSTTGWNAPNTGATNESGFTGLPGGDRYYDYFVDSFYEVGNRGSWWSATEDNANGAWYVFLYYTDSTLGSGETYKRYGFSVRCVRD